MNRRVKLAHLVKWRFCLLVVLNLCLDLCIADQCFDSFMTPKIITTDPFTYCDIEAIAKDWENSTIFVGGSINKKTAEQTAMLAALDADGINGYQWRKLYKLDGMVTITALAVDKGTLQYLAVHGSEVSQSEFPDDRCCYAGGTNRIFPGTLNSFIFTVSVSDGSIHTRPIKITHKTGGTDNDYAYMITSSGFRFKSDQILAAVHSQNTVAWNSGDVPGEHERMRLLQLDITDDSNYAYRVGPKGKYAAMDYIYTDADYS